MRERRGRWPPWAFHYNRGMTDAVSLCTHGDIVILGGGAAGVLTTIRLLEAATDGRQLLLVEPASRLGEGIAYATTREEHLLNVPAGKMSGFAERPDDFVDYLIEAGVASEDQRAQLRGRYVGRRHYAPYLRQRLQQARAGSAASLRVIAARAVAVERDAGRCRVQLDDGTMLDAAALVLAVGNAPRPLPGRGATALGARRIDAWQTAAVAAIAPEQAVGIVGSGLSMADALLTLCASQHRGPVHVLSRHALLPLPHAEGAPAEFDHAPLLRQSLRQRMRTLRRHVAEAAQRGIPWQSVMDRLRPHGQALWCSLDAADQRRFLRHVVRYWDVHRHRVAATVHAQLQAMRDSGQLVVHRGRVDALIPAGNCVQLCAIDRRGAELRLEVQALLNATGVEMRVQAMHSPLLAQLIGSGVGAPGPHGIGVATSVDGQLLDAQGTADPRIRVIGSLRIGTLWESLAIPELREQAREAAAALLSLR